MDDRQIPSRWEKLIAPRAMLAGVGVMFLACCVAGRVISRQPLYTNFVRFHQLISPQSLYYPTASQVEVLAEAQAEPDEVLVIIGGSSVTSGVGQRVEHVWTKKLEAFLGRPFRVINLGLPSCGAMEFGGVAAEIVAKRHTKVLFVTTATISGRAGDASFGVYKYFFWDAVYKGLIPADAEHEAWVAKLLKERDGDKAFPEMQREMQVDRVAFSRDLWTAVAYREWNTVWNPWVCGTFVTPRSEYADPELGGLVPFEMRYPPNKDDHFTKIARDELEEEAVLRGDRPPLVVNVENVLPASSRARSLVLLFSRSPYYVQRLSADEQRRYYELYRRGEQVLEKNGIPALSIGINWTTDDYYNFAHAGEQGGVKLAEAVAARLRQMAEGLGYIQGGDGP